VSEHLAKPLSLKLSRFNGGITAADGFQCGTGPWGAGVIVIDLPLKMRLCQEYEDAESRD